MKASDKEIPRSRRPRTLPPSASQVEVDLLSTAEPHAEVKRFYDRTAQLAALSTQVRTSTSSKDKAVSAGRLARQLVRRGIELRDALALGEKSLTILSDPELGLDVAGWWALAGDAYRGAQLADSIVDELPETERRQALLTIAMANIRLEKAEPAARALRRMIDLAPDSPTAYELFGSLGFWSDLPRDECARSFLRASDLRRRSGDESNAFESQLRAFEVDPSCTEAASDLSTALRERGRPGAADEILREHLRSATASQRAAHHQRAFYASFLAENFENTFESALEAELDIDLDLDRVCALVLENARPRQDFEGFLWRLISEGIWGQSNTLASWMLALCEIHRGPDDTENVIAIERTLVGEFQAESLPSIDWSDNEAKARSLRTTLGTDRDLASQFDLRFELTRRLCLLRLWEEAQLVLAPLLETEEVSVAIAAFGAALGGRTSRALARVRAMIALAPSFPGPAGAVTYAVAAERLLNFGMLDEAHQAADAAVEALPVNERAIATQALVALRAPDGASASLLEHSLSVLVARSDACALLSESASQRGSGRLSLTWAGRALALRPGDVNCARRYLQQACALRDSSKIVEVLSEVLEQAVPLTTLQSDVCDCLTLLTQCNREKVVEIGTKIIATLPASNELICKKLTDLADLVGAHELLAALVESQLVRSEASSRAQLYLELVNHRLFSGQLVAAARALRRAQLSSVSEATVKDWLARFPTLDEPDAELPVLEMLAEFKEGVTDAVRCERLLVAGCARWDMAQDSDQAVRLWLCAADLEKEHGLELFAQYLRQIAGPEAAVDHLKAAARNTEDPVRSGKLLGYAARELLRMGKKRDAFRLAFAALERAPALSELLAIAEMASDQETLVDLQRLYQLLADSALGKFGERAAHYRAARQLEKRGALEAALTHACSAFEAAPAEGVAYVLMVRLADATFGHAQLLTSIQKVADHCATHNERARWISLAAALSDTDSIGRRERLEILWRAVQMTPQMETLDAFIDGLAHCLVDDPKSRDELWERFVKLARESNTIATGSIGASRCLRYALTALTHFEQPDFALECAVSAVECDTRAAEFSNLKPYVHQLAGIVGPANELVELVRATEQQKDVQLGKDLAELVGRIAELLGEPEVLLELLVRAAVDFPGETELVTKARQLSFKSDRFDLIAKVDDLLPADDRAQILLSRLDSLTLDEGLSALLDLELDTLDVKQRSMTLLERGRRQEAIGRAEDAVKSYRLLLELEPDSLAALLGLERHAELHGNHEDLLHILGRRIELSQDAGEIRRLTLRRSAVLETKLGRAPEARKLLQDFLGRGEDRAALRLLADSWERTGDHTEAAELWERVFSVALDRVEADDAAYRAAACFAQAGTPRRANESLERILHPTLAHLELALDVARSVGEKAQICSAIVALCGVLLGDHERLGRLLLEAAQLAAALKRPEDAQTYADRALHALPESSEIKLLVARLRAQAGALSTSVQAEKMSQLLTGTESLASAADREMAVFLRAKSLILSSKRSEAKLLLETSIEEQGGRALLAALLAELLENDDEYALKLIDVALGGECYGFFSVGDLLLRAGSLARKLGDFDRARGLISAVSEDDPLRARAARELDELSVQQAQIKRLAHGSSQSSPEHDAVNADSSGSEQVEQRSQHQNEQHELQEQHPVSSRRMTSDLASIRRAAREEHRRAARDAMEHQELAGPTSRRSSRPALRVVVAASLDVDEDSLRSPPIPIFDDEDVSSITTESSTSSSDESLLMRLESGEIEAGIELLGRLHADRSRSRDAVIVAQHLAFLNPGDAGLLGRLVTAAFRDGNEALAAAVRHVLGAYGVGEPVVPPSLEEIFDQGGAGLALLRQAQGSANEALALVWDYAHGFFKKELSDYGLSGLERVPFNTSNLVGALCQGVSKVTGLMKTPVFCATGADEISIQVALLQPPAVIVAGVIDELSPELMFHFGAMMAACAPEHALVFGADQKDVQDILSALALSFGAGRPDNRERPPEEVTRVASFLWETVPSRVQRRLSQLCAEPSELTYAALSGHSRLAVRRAGLMACGDLPTAIDDACAEFSLPPPRSLRDLAEVVSSCPAAHDLLQLSLSSEYAQIRFQTTK